MKVFSAERRKVKAALIVLLCLCIVSVTSGCGYDKSTIVNTLRDEGYVVEQSDDNTLIISEDGVDYYFKTGLFRPALVKIVTKLQVENHDTREVEIVITKGAGQKRSVSYANYTDEGKLIGSNAFEFKYDFSDEHMTNDHGFPLEALLRSLLKQA